MDDDRRGRPQGDELKSSVWCCRHVYDHVGTGMTQRCALAGAFHIDGMWAPIRAGCEDLPGLLSASAREVVCAGHDEVPLRPAFGST